MTPLRQGDLDSLCGLYCVVNAVRMATMPTTKIGERKSKDLINHIAYDLGDGFPLIFDEGLNNLKPLLRSARKWLYQSYGNRLHVQRPFRRRSPPLPEDLATTIITHMAAPHTAVIVCNPAHWSVIERVTPKQVILFDSSCRHFMRLCPDRDQTTNANVVIPHKVYLLSITTPE